MQQYSSLIIILALLDCPSFVKPVEEGTYEAFVYNITSCAAEPPWFHSNITVYTSRGRKLLRGEVVTKKELKNPKFRVKVHYMESGLADPMDLTNLNCHAIVVRVLLRALRMSYDGVKCTLSPSSSEFSNVDINAILHSVREKLKYGHIRIRWEMAAPAAKLICLDVNVKIVKATNNSAVKPAKT